MAARRGRSGVHGSPEKEFASASHQLETKLSALRKKLEAGGFLKKSEVAALERHLFKMMLRGPNLPTSW